MIHRKWTSLGYGLTICYTGAATGMTLAPFVAGILAPLPVVMGGLLGLVVGTWLAVVTQDNRRLHVAMFPIGSLVIVVGFLVFCHPIAERLQGRAVGLGMMLGAWIALNMLAVVASIGLAVIAAGWLKLVEQLHSMHPD